MPQELEATERARIAILISGRGSNMIALAEAVREGRLPNAEVMVVISDQPNAPGLAKAKDLGIDTLLIERRRRPRTEHDHEIVVALQARNIDLVCLAGYMRLLSPAFIAAYRGRILNIHPSLLPLFPGLDAQRQALKHGAKVSGCTVHFVDETLDGGPIIEQRVVPVHDDDTVESLSARILEEEHKLYPEAVAMVLGRNASILEVGRDQRLVPTANRG
ncbi:MAG: phosphoribosylglycinamide formyltransferase 1 [Blastocatellia bacterium]|jgi:phosphoribosylglycinamide formyltransferase-1|nr:phosphoribosylglycinamide formyltransferase 1 [Blastocatellia bacterium]